MSNPDDLDDGLLYDYSSGGEQVEEENEEIEHTEPAKESPSDGIAEKKRTLIDEEREEERPMSKRQKKLSKRSKLIEKKKESHEYEKNRKMTLPKSTPEEVSAYFSTLIREKNPDLSAIELEEKYLKKTDFLSTAKYTQERTLENFPDFIKQFSKAPKTIIFSLTNLRVADVFRTLNKERTCVKLFAKNKLKDDLKMVDMVFDTKNKKFSNIRYFVCTPTRLSKIIETNDSFFQGKDKLDIILDASFLDPKENTLLTADDAITLATTLRILLDKKSSVKVLLY